MGWLCQQAGVHALCLRLLAASVPCPAPLLSPLFVPLYHYMARFELRFRFEGLWSTSHKGKGQRCIEIKVPEGRFVRNT